MYGIFCFSFPWNFYIDFQKCNGSVSRVMFSLFHSMFLYVSFDIRCVFDV